MEGVSEEVKGLNGNCQNLRLKSQANLSLFHYVCPEYIN